MEWTTVFDGDFVAVEGMLLKVAGAVQTPIATVTLLLKAVKR